MPVDGREGGFSVNNGPLELFGFPNTAGTMRYIEPGDASQSYMYLKLIGGPGIQGARIPSGRPPLPAEDLGRLAEWIGGL